LRIADLTRILVAKDGENLTASSLADLRR